VGLVLGIDAAWTLTGTSGVALMHCTPSERRVIAVAPSFSDFINLAQDRPTSIDVPSLIHAAEMLGSSQINVVAIDMPMSLLQITGRRVADQEVSRAFGAAGGSTHSPNPSRPGWYGQQLTEGFINAGFPLRTRNNPPKANSPSLIEVFPLVALIRLMNLTKRPPYKVTKTTKYWPNFSLDARIALLLNTWDSIFAALGGKVSQLNLKVPARGAVHSLASLKPLEDMLDAIISAWVGACFLNQAVQSFGDNHAAIWIPT